MKMVWSVNVDIVRSGLAYGTPHSHEWSATDVAHAGVPVVCLPRSSGNSISQDAFRAALCPASTSCRVPSCNRSLSSTDLRSPILRMFGNPFGCCRLRKGLGPCVPEKSALLCCTQWRLPRSRGMPRIRPGAIVETMCGRPIDLQDSLISGRTLPIAE